MITFEKLYYMYKCLKIPLSPYDYWNKYTVSRSFTSREDSIAQYLHVCKEYKNYCKHAGFTKPEIDKFNGKDVLVFGCGTGTEIVPILEHASPNRIVACDISKKALDICRHRILFHEGNEVVKVVELQKGETYLSGIGEFDYVISLGVLHHLPIIKPTFDELYRVMRPGGSMRLMVYNEDSIYFHLSVGYVHQILKGIDPTRCSHDAFRRLSEHGNSPCSYLIPPCFIPILSCDHKDSTTTHIGNSLCRTEIEDFDKYYFDAMSDKRLSSTHKSFLRNVTRDMKYNGEYAGIDQFWEVTKC